MQQFISLHYLIIRHAFGYKDGVVCLTFYPDNVLGKNILSGFMRPRWENLSRASR